MPEEAVLFYVLYLRVGDRGLAYRTPVDDAGTLVDVSFLVEFYKYFQNCVGAAFVHGKALSVPVGRRTQLVKLLYDPGAVLLSPLPALL